MFRLEMLPAAHGDSLWITCGAPDVPRRVLIDGGMTYVYDHLRSKLLALPPGHRKIDLLVVTHVDADHVGGILLLLQDASLGVEIGEIWFNGQPQLDRVPDPVDDGLGEEQGEILGALISRYEEESGRRVWNRHFDGGPVMVPEQGELPAFDLDGLRLTVLCPGLGELQDLKDRWDRVVREAGWEPGDQAAALARLAERRDLAPPDELGDDELAARAAEGELDEASRHGPVDDVLGGADAAPGSDRSVANGSSIALLAEWEGGRALLAGDAHASGLAAGLGRWLGEESERRGRTVERVELDLFKLSHHGSITNVSGELLDLLSCRHYLFSTSGKIYGHPHDRTVELVLDHHHPRGKPHLYFNYRTGRNERWAEGARGHEAHYPSGLEVEVPMR